MIDSIRPSVTRWYHAKMTPATITRSSLEDSPMTLVYKFIDFCSGSSSKEYHQVHCRRLANVHKGQLMHTKYHGYDFKQRWVNQLVFTTDLFCNCFLIHNLQSFDVAGQATGSVRLLCVVSFSVFGVFSPVCFEFNCTSDCLKRLVSEVTYYALCGTQNYTHSLTPLQ